MKIFVYYEGYPNYEFDDKLKTTFKEAGFRWIGAGYGLCSGKRDHSFEIDGYENIENIEEMELVK